MRPGTLTLSGDCAADRARLAHLIGELRAIRAQVAEDPYLLYATDGALDRAPARRRAARRRHARSTRFAPPARAATWSASMPPARRTPASQFVRAAQLVHGAELQPRLELLSRRRQGGEGRATRARAGTPRSSQRKVDTAAEQLVGAGAPAAPAAAGALSRLPRAGSAATRSSASSAGAASACARTAPRPHRWSRWSRRACACTPACACSRTPPTGIAPDFQSAGFIRPDRVVLIEGGAYRDCLVSPRSAAEYGVETNGASASEAPASIEVAAAASRPTASCASSAPASTSATSGT